MSVIITKKISPKINTKLRRIQSQIRAIQRQFLAKHNIPNVTYTNILIVYTPHLRAQSMRNYFCLRVPFYICCPSNLVSTDLCIIGFIYFPAFCQSFYVTFWGYTFPFSLYCFPLFKVYTYICIIRLMVKDINILIMV